MLVTPSTSRAVAVVCAAVLWVGWIIACGNDDKPAPAAPAAPAPSASDDPSSFDPATREHFLGRFYTTWASGKLSLQDFNELTDQLLGPDAAFHQQLAAACTQHPVGQPRLDCVEAGGGPRLATADAAAPQPSSWKAHAQPH